MSKNIVLMTATGAENLGDELITLCEIQRFQREEPETTITLFSHDPARTWRFFRAQNLEEKNVTILPYFPTHIRQHPLKNIFYFFQTLSALYHSSHVYIGGGGLFYSTTEEGHSPLKLWWIRAMIAKLLGKPLTYLSIGVSTKKQELQKYARVLFHNTSMSVRDSESQQRIKEVGYCADISLDPVFEYIPKNTELKKKEGITIGIALRSGFIKDDIVEHTVRELSKKNYTIYLLPHSLHPDDISSHDGYYLQRFLFPGVKITQTIEQTLATYPLCDVIIGMRLHSIILANKMKIPLIAVSYSTKTESILQQLQYEFLQAQEATADILLSQIESILNAK